MKIRRVSTLLCVVVAAAYGCANPATGKPEAAVAEPKPAAAPAPAASAIVYELSSDSKIGFVGSKITGSHDGGFASFEGGIELVQNDPEQSRIHVAIDTTSLWADNPKLTEHLKSADFFDVASHPTAEFSSTAIVAEGEGYRVTGNLLLHGVEKSISFPASIEVLDDSIVASAEFSIKRFDFGIAYKGKADDLIRDEVVIKLDLAASPAAS